MTTIEAPDAADSDTSDRGPTPRLVRKRDFPALEVLDKEVFGELAYSMHLLRTFYNLFRKSWYVVDREGELAGYALVGPGFGTGESWLLGLAVSGRHQGHNLGNLLMDQAVKVMIDSGLPHGYITVRPENEAAKHLYRKFGFSQVGAEEPNYYGNGESREVLHRDFTLPSHRR